MEEEHFIAALAALSVDLSNVSLAMVGYRLSEKDLRQRLNAEGLAVNHVTTDLYVAANWRNDPSNHAIIIALAKGSYIADCPRVKLLK